MYLIPLPRLSSRDERSHTRSLEETRSPNERKRVYRPEVRGCCRVVFRFSSATPNCWQHAKPAPPKNSSKRNHPSPKVSRRRWRLAVGTQLISSRLLDPTGTAFNVVTRFRPRDSLAERAYLDPGRKRSVSASEKKRGRERRRLRRVRECYTAEAQLNCVHPYPRSKGRKVTLCRRE